jgi:hypothetical protein
MSSQDLTVFVANLNAGPRPAPPGDRRART